LQDALSQATAELASLRERGTAAGGSSQPKPAAPGAVPTEISKASSTLVGVPKPGSTAISRPAAASPVKPLTPAPRPASAPAAPTAPAAPGLKPVARPAVPATSAAGAGGPARPSSPATRPAAGPSGTQRISIPASKPQPLPKLSAAGLPKLGSVPKAPGVAGEERPGE
jgi:hypothetical protein